MKFSDLPAQGIFINVLKISATCPTTESDESIPDLLNVRV